MDDQEDLLSSTEVDEPLMSDEKQWPLARTRNREAAEGKEIQDTLRVISVAHRHLLSACHYWPIIVTAGPMDGTSIKLTASRHRFYRSRSEMFVFTNYSFVAKGNTNTTQCRRRL